MRKQRLSKWQDLTFPVGTPDTPPTPIYSHLLKQCRQKTSGCDAAKASILCSVEGRCVSLEEAFHTSLMCERCLLRFLMMDLLVILLQNRLFKSVTPLKVCFSCLWFCSCLGSLAYLCVWQHMAAFGFSF